MRIGELAKALGTTTKTLRHYEQKGLLRPSHRTDNGYREYGEQEVNHARKVMGLRQLGLSIQEVHDLLAGDPAGTTLRMRLLGLFDEKLRDFDERLGILQGRREDLETRYLSMLDTPPDQDGSCICAALLIPCQCAKSDKRPTKISPS